ncbi:nucleotidyltransferase domain-containing protein [Candidatus Woesearchaeota archaeon]|nr:nucleotidyltransferase domain-containing protein [Candidatus Woesearchaeota archaeon]
MYKLQLTILEQEVLNFLFIRKGEVFTARALAVALNVSQPGIGKALRNLEKEDYIKVIKNKETKRLSISLNEDNILIHGLKRANNIKLLYESKLVEELSKKFPGTTIILFGSYAWGEDTIRSDIDIAVIGAKQKEINLEAFEKKLEREININFYDFFKRIDKHLLNNILNGITINGAIEL